MFFIAWKNLFQERSRTLISISGVTLSILLIVTLQGLYNGWKNEMGQYLRALPADLWVEQEGAKDMFHTVSALQLESKDKIKNIPGVSEVVPFTGRRFSLALKGKEAMLYIVGFDSSAGIGGPLRVVEGKKVPDRGEIVVDRAFAEPNDVHVGDKLAISEREFKVAGISDGGSVVVFSFAFIPKDDADTLFRMPGLTNYFMVRLADNADEEKIRAEIEGAVPDSAVVAKHKFVEDNTSLVRESFLPIIAVLLVIGFAVGVAVIGLTIFTSTIEKSREYGVLKAIGISNGQLNRIVMQQAFLVSVTGYILGAAGAALLSSVIGGSIPEFATQFRIVDFIWIFGATLLMAALASYLPIYRIGKIDPAEVFKS